MAKFTTNAGTKFNSETEVNTTTNTPDINTQIKESESLLDNDKLTTVSESDTVTGDKDKKTLTFTTRKSATPLSVYSQFSQGFIESLMWLPDTSIRKVALGISDTYNLGWNEDDVFQFADLLNKNKLGYMSGSTGVDWVKDGQKSGPVMGDQYILENEGPQNEWEKWSHMSGDLAGLSATFFTGAGFINAMKTPMKYRKMVEVSPGKYEWITDTAKMRQAGKGELGLTGAGQEYLNWIANNPIKAAQMDLLFSTGAATGIYTADRQLTDEFREQHPVLSSLVETGAMVVGSLAAPAVVIGTAKGVKGAGIFLTKTPIAGTGIKLTGQYLNKLLSLRSVAAQRDYIRSLQDQVDGAVYKQIKDVWQAAINDPASVIPREIAMLTKQNVVGGEALQALRTQFLKEGMNEEQISAQLFKMLNDAETGTITIGNQDFTVGKLAQAALQAYENTLRNSGKYSEVEILQMLQNQKLQLSIGQMAPSAKNIATQVSIESKASGEQLNLIMDRKQTNEKILRGFYQNMFATDENAPLVVIDTLSGRIIQSNAIQKEILDQGDVLSNIAAQSNIKPLTGTDSISGGQTIREIIETNRKLAMKPFEAEDALINQLGPNMKVANFKDFKKDLLLKIYGPTAKPTYFENPEEFPLVIQKILNTPDNEPISLLAVWKLYKQITNAAFDASLAKSLGVSGKDAYSNLYMTQQALMDFMKNKMIPLRRLDDGTARTLDKFFTDYKSQVADIYNKGAVFKMNQIQVGGGYYTAPEKVADHFLKSSDTAKNFKVLIDNISDPIEQGQLNSAVRDVILDKIYKANVINKEGAIDSIKLNKWMEKNDAWLKFWPNIKEGLLNSKKLTDDAGNRIIALKTRHENIEKNFIKEKLKPIIDIVNSEIQATAQGTAAGFTGETQDALIYTVNDLIKKALKDPVLMKTLRDAAGAQFGKIDSRNAFRSMVWKNVGDMIPLENGAAVKKWMESEPGKEVMKLMYNNNQIKTLKTLVDAYDTIYRIPDPAAIADITPPGIKRIQEQLGSSVQSFTSILRSWREGRISGRNTFIYLASRLFSTQQKRKIQAAYFEAFSNPDLANFLSKDLFINYNLNKGGFGYFTELNKNEAKKIAKYLWNIGIKVAVEDLIEPPALISDSKEYTVTDDGVTVKDTSEGAIPSENPTKFERVGEEVREIPEASLNINMPDVVPASQLANQNEIQLASAPISNNITEERFSSFYPYDTTGQMIASRNTVTMAQGGIVNAVPKTRQRVL
jgi:hypothetical protein